MGDKLFVHEIDLLECQLFGTGLGGVSERQLQLRVGANENVGIQIGPLAPDRIEFAIHPAVKEAAFVLNFASVQHLQNKVRSVHGCVEDQLTLFRVVGLVSVDGRSGFGRQVRAQSLRSVEGALCDEKNFLGVIKGTFR